MRSLLQKKIDILGSRLFTNFAKHGHPTLIPKPSKGDITITWEHQDRDSNPFLFIGDELKVTELDFATKKRIDFWNRIVRDAGHSDWVLSDLRMNKIHRETADKRSSIF